MEIRLIGTVTELKEAMATLREIYTFTNDGQFWPSRQKKASYIAYLNDVKPKN